MLRTIRIVGIALALASLFQLSRQFSLARGEEQPAGYWVALAVVTVLFLVRAASTEYAGRNISVAQRDLLWGLSLGAFLSMLARLMN